MALCRSHTWSRARVHREVAPSQHVDLDVMHRAAGLQHACSRAWNDCLSHITESLSTDSFPCRQLDGWAAHRAGSADATEAMVKFGFPTAQGEHHFSSAEAQCRPRKCQKKIPKLPSLAPSPPLNVSGHGMSAVVSEWITLSATAWLVDFVVNFVDF